MSKENVIFNDEEIQLVQHLISSYRDAYCIPDTEHHEEGTIYAYLKRLERKMKRALEDSRTEFV